MIQKLKPIPIRANQAITCILDDGFDSFIKVIKGYCCQNGSHDTILGWGSEKTYLSIFCQGLISSNRYCFLEMPFYRAVKYKRRGNKKYKKGRVDALLIDRSLSNKTLTAIIEAKAVDTTITEESKEGKINLTMKALEKAKDQLQRIDREDIYSDEEKGSERHIYRIALIFTALRARFAYPGEGKSLEYYKCNELRHRAEEYFKAVMNKIDREYTYNYTYIHSIPQLELIKKYYDSKMFVDGEEIDRPYKSTYYKVGVLVTAAIFE